MEPRLRQRNAGLQRRSRILVIVDDFARENLALDLNMPISGACVVRALHAIIAVRGKPLMIVSDNGTELTTRRS